MSDSEKEIENQILEAGEKLVDPPSSLDELLPLLDVSSLLLNANCVHVFSVRFLDLRHFAC